MTPEDYGSIRGRHGLACPISGSSGVAEEEERRCGILPTFPWNRFWKCVILSSSKRVSMCLVRAPVEVVKLCSSSEPISPRCMSKVVFSSVSGWESMEQLPRLFSSGRPRCLMKGFPRVGDGGKAGMELEARVGARIMEPEDCLGPPLAYRFPFTLAQVSFVKAGPTSSSRFVSGAI